MATGTRAWPKWVAVALLTLISGFILISCDELFVNDGNEDSGIASRPGYFYFIDNENQLLLQLDHNLVVAGSWSTHALFYNDSIQDTVRIQGITFDGKKLWLSVAGDFDSLLQIDISGDSISILNSFAAPPARRGTIRDIAWDGNYLWAINSGSVTYDLPPTLYKLNPDNGAVLDSFAMPTPEPRGLTWTETTGDAYGRGAATGLYYGETSQDQIIYFSTEKQQFDTVFASPQPPSGQYDIFPVGLTFDGEYFWLVNSANAGDYLYKLDYHGVIKEQVELSYKTPGPLVWSTVDASVSNPPTVLSVSPNTGTRGSFFGVTITGNNFKPGTGLQVSFGEGVEVSNIAFVDGSTLSADIQVTDSAAFGTRDVTVTNPDGKSGTGTGLFTILEINPNEGYLWMAETNGKLLYKIHILDTVVTQTWDLTDVATSGSVQGLTYDGANIWMSAAGTDDKIIKVNTSDATLSTELSFTAPPAAAGIVRELAFLGSDLWVANSTTAHVYKVNQTTGVILDSIAAPGAEIRGLAVANGQLYCTDRTIDSVFVYDFDVQNWTALFATPTPSTGDESNRYSTGMTFDGVNFWILNSTYEFDYVYQVSLTGEVLKEYALPLQGDATWSGVAFTQD
jgi:hypothetical protein